MSLRSAGWVGLDTPPCCAVGNCFLGASGIVDDEAAGTSCGPSAPASLGDFDSEACDGAWRDACASDAFTASAAFAASDTFAASETLEHAVDAQAAESCSCSRAGCRSASTSPATAVKLYNTASSLYNMKTAFRQYNTKKSFGDVRVDSWQLRTQFHCQLDLHMPNRSNSSRQLLRSARQPPHGANTTATCMQCQQLMPHAYNK